MTCHKITYPSRYAANLELLHIWRKHQHGDTDRREIADYQCPHCDGWHLTSQREEPTKETE